MKPFYGKEIHPQSEQQLIKKILSKYRHESVSKDLKKMIYDELMHAKKEGKISIPFKVVMRRFPGKEHRDYIEVIVDTKV